MSFSTIAARGTSFGFASTNVPLPAGGSPTVVRVANLGPCHISILLGDNALTVTQSTGVVVMAGQVEYLVIPEGGTSIAGVAAGGPGNTSTVNLATGIVA